MAETVDVGELVIKLRGDLSSLQADVRKMESTFSGGFNNVQTKAASAGRQIAGALGVGLSVATFGNFIRGIISTNDRLSDLADQTKFTAQALSGIRTTLENAGVSVEQFARGIQLSQRTLGQIDSEGDKAAQAIKALGLNVGDLQKLAPEDFFKTVVKAIAEFGDQNSRAALQAAIFSRSGLQLSGVIDVLARDFDKLKASGLNEQTIRDLGALSDSMNTFSNRLADTAAGPLARFIDQLRQLIGLRTPLEELFFKLSKLDDQIKLDKLFSTQFNLSSFRFEQPGGAGLKDLLAEREKTAKAIREIAIAQDEAERSIGITGGGKKFSPVDPKAAQDAKALAESLRHQIIELEAQRLEFQKGANAALEYKLTQDAILQVGRQLTNAERGQINEIVSRRKAIDNQVKGLEVLREQAAKFAEEQEKSVSAGRTFSDILQSVTNEGLDPLGRELAEAEKRFSDLKINMQLAGIESKQTTQAMQALADQIDFLKSQAQLKITVQAQGPTGLDLLDLSEGQDRSAIIDREATSLKRYSVALADIAKELKIVGPSFDDLAAEISAVQERLRAMVQGPEWDTLKGELDTLVAQKNFRDAFVNISSSITDGIRETVIGIQRGEQTLGEGMKNMFRNALLELNVAILDEGIFKPLQNISKAFFGGFAKAFIVEGSTAAEDIAREFGKTLGTSLRNVIGKINFGGGSSPGGGGISIPSFSLSGIWGWITNLFKEDGGLIPKFAMGGEVPAILHKGEFVLRRAAVDAIGVDALYKANRDLKLPRMEWGGYIPNTAFTVPRFQGGGVVVPGSSDANKQPVIIELTQDYTGSVAPSDLKTGKKEVQRFVLEALNMSPGFRAEIRHASRK